MSQDLSQPPSARFTLADIARWFDAHTIRKAQAYGARVRDIEIQPDTISARVKGNAPKPYQVALVLRETPRGLNLLSMCSCPVRTHCKHAVAVLVAVHAQRDTPARVNPKVLEWAERARVSLTARGRVAAKKAKPASATLHYVIVPDPRRGAPRLALLKGRIDADRPLTAQHWNNIERALVQPPQFVDELDLDIFRPLNKIARRQASGFWNDLPLSDTDAAAALALIAGSGRAWLATPAPEGGPSYAWRMRALTAGKPRPGALAWQPAGEAQVQARVAATPPATFTLSCDPPWYVDAQSGELGPLACGERAPLLRQLLDLPPLGAMDVPVVASLIDDLAPELPRPGRADALPMPEIGGAPRAVLRLNTLSIWGMGQHRGYPGAYGARGLIDFATAHFVYGEGAQRAEVLPKEVKNFVTLANGQVARLARDAATEAARLDALRQAGFEPVPARVFHGDAPPGMLGLDSEADWRRFFGQAAPALRAQGWEIDVPRGFRHYVLEPEAWQAELEEDANGWFTLNMGILVEGQRLPLAPLLADLFRQDDRWLTPSRLKRIKNSEAVTLNTPDGKRVRVTAERIKPLASTLIDLFDSVPASGEIKLSKLDAPRLETLTDTSRWQFKGGDAVLDMARRLQASQGVKPVPAPPGFALELRPYQREGLAWLQYLRAQGLGGILADDMGLGKTAQTLAHLLAEKQAGRLERPVLVVLPTSLVFNWRREAERCAPALKVLSLHGKARAEVFPRIPEHDVCLTTYPLLWRDEAELAQHAYSLLILDEAQTVKNAQARAAAVVRKLQAEHRLCLTGTPLENHLGELWAQFDFLLPGFLGDSKQFAKTWRTPIEKHGDALRGELLARRIAPFILRRKKEEVAKELPEKSVIVRTVELEGGQRDLYETVRAAMDAKVRDEIASKGFNRSQIVILDALLKLRQVCCDPRLLKSVAAAEKVKERAKLALLMDMLPELVEEGRKVLLFSQFTTMLDLIAEALDAAGIPFLSLTGQTQAREKVVAEFQAGLAPVFLISLKAGGVGLNLTAADTVIHFDPWWNPAAENQATDRAHRIGQKNRVFVYKLVVAGSIEERIVALQDKKAALAEGVLSEDAGALAKFGEADLRALLAPLPGK